MCVAWFDSENSYNHTMNIAHTTTPFILKGMEVVLSYVVNWATEARSKKKITLLMKGMHWETCMVFDESEIEDLLDEFCFEDKLWKLEPASRCSE